MKPLVYLHIPKTAGTSFIEMVSRNFRDEEICRITDTYRSPGEIGADIEVAIAEGKRFVCGHFPYAAIGPLRDDVDVFTVLRDPVDRVVSLYKFWRTTDPQSGGSSASQFACSLARRLNFDDFLRCEHPLLVSATRDEMCKSLAGHVSQHPDGAEAADIVQSARATLGTVAFGLTGDFDRSRRLLSHQLQLNLLERVHLNSTSHLAAPALDDGLRARITRSNLADTMLFDHAEREFERSFRCAEIAALHREIGDRALTPLVRDDRGGFCWDASMPVSGSHWNDREALGDGSHYRFTESPETEVHFPDCCKPGRLAVAVEVPFFNTLAMVDRYGGVDPRTALAFRVNGVDAAMSAEPLGEGGAVFTIAVDEGCVRGPVLTLTIRSPYGISPAVFGSPDARNLLAAIRSIRFAPRLR